MKKLLFSVLVVAVSGLFGTALARTDSGVESIGGYISDVWTDAPGDTSLTTLFASDNNFAGNSFDLHVHTPITVVGWDVNLAANLPNYTINVYWKWGTADGSEQDAGAWTLLGTTSVVPNGVDVPTHIDIGGLAIDYSDTVVGVIIQSPDAVSGTGGFSYTNGGPNTYSNNDLDIITYRGMSQEWPPASVFAYRAWNGTVHYDYGVSLQNSSWAGIKTAF